MERQSERRREGSQEPAASDSDLRYTGGQFEEADTERGVSFSELADTTLSSWSHPEDNGSCGGLNDEPMVDKASGPESLTDSSTQSQEWKNPLDVGDGDLTAANQTDPWRPFPRWAPTTSTYAKQVAFRFAMRVFDALFTSPAKVSEGTAAPSEQTDPGHASMPGYSPAACPANWTRPPQDIRTEEELPVAQNAENMAEVQTVCSDQSSVDTNRSQDYVWEFTRHLYQRIRPLLTDDTVSSALDLLPDLLSAFALQKGQESQAQINQDIRYFVYKHRLIIAQLLGAFYEIERPPIANPISGTSPMSVTERIGLIWNKASQKGNSSATEECPDPVVDADGEGDLPRDFSQYREAITAGPAFQWLVEEFKRELSPSSTGLHTMERISSDILKGLSKDQKIGKRHPSKLSKLTFDVACDIFAYMEEQGYVMDADEALPRAITLTGSSTNAQALTIRQYVCQTWPTIKCHLVQAIQAALRVYKASGYDASKPFQNSSKCIVEGVGTEFRVSIGEKMMNVEAVGTARSLADIGEQLGWLATTLSSSHRERVISFCHPEISGFSAHLKEDGFDSIFICRINTETEQLWDNPPDINGQCWYHLFNNPVVVTGYPTKPRIGSMVEAGLELPLDMMATLSECQFLTTWEGRTVIKGFSTMLIPTKAQDNIISWHLLVAEADKRLSYADVRVQKGISIAPERLSNSRHVLGWCVEAQNDIGSPNANYNIGWSGLPLAENDVSWGPVTTSLGVGGFFKLSSDFERGNRERIISSFTDTHYGFLVRHIGQQHFLLWDVGEVHGYLDDGSRVHLHLVRASLWEDHRENPNSYYNDQIRKLDNLALQKQDAAGVLLDAGNLDAEAERRDPAYSSLNTRMQRIGFLMEKAIDQVHKATNSQSTLVGKPVRFLEGFDFMDVATLRNLHLRRLKLPFRVRSRHGWTHIVPHLPVVTLFGKQFGELITPGANSLTKSCDKCGSVDRLPSGRYLLAVPVDVLEEILRIRGNRDSHPWQLMNDIYWQPGENIFEDCRCTGSDRGGNKDGRVQVIYEGKPESTSFSKSIKLEERGAVIFGHSFRLPFRSSRPVLSHDGSSSSDITSALQKTNQAPDMTVPAKQDENFGTDEPPLSDTASLTTRNTAGWSKTEKTEASGSNNTTIEQRNQGLAPPCAQTSIPPASPPQIEPTEPTKAPPPQTEPSKPTKSPRKRSAKRMKEFCASVWKRVKMTKGRKMDQG